MIGTINASSTAQVDIGVVSMYAYAFLLALLLFAVFKMLSYFKW